MKVALTIFEVGEVMRQTSLQITVDATTEETAACLLVTAHSTTVSQ